ncbi:TonB-dependent receptor [Phyllobacterium sp. K27]
MLVRGGVSATAVVLGTFLGVPAAAQRMAFEIPAQRLETAITAFGRQTNVQIIASRRVTKGKRSSPVRGYMTPREALVRLLDGTGLIARPTGSQTFAILYPSRPITSLPLALQTMRGSPHHGSSGAGSPRSPSAEAPLLAEDEDIVVTGIRESLESSARAKREAELTLDSISAEEVGKFPDSNIAESLQRITGVAIDRSGGEGQFITVRGLGPEFNTVLVNGRVMATDNAGREFSFDVLSSAMIQRADVYKSSIAPLQEGGIGATVNIATARPMDGKVGFHVAAAAGGIYDDLRKTTTPDVSAVASLMNEAKTIGFVISGSYTDRRSQSDAVQVDGWLFSQQSVLHGTGQSAGLTADALDRTATSVHVPQNLNFARENSRRRRINASATVEAQLTDRLTLSLDGIYSKFDASSDRSIFASFYSSPYIALTVDENGTATAFERPGQLFQVSNPALANRISLSQNDNIVQTGNRLTQSYQIGGNLKWRPFDDVEVRFDASKTKATQRSPGSYVVLGSFAQTSPRFDLNKGGDLPIGSNFGNLTDPSLVRAHYTRVDEGRVRDLGSEYRLDTEYKLQSSALKSISFGVSYSERSKFRQYFENSDAACAYCGYEIPVEPSLLRTYHLGGFLPKASGSEYVPHDFFTFDPRAVIAFLSDPGNLARPRQGRDAAEQRVEGARLLALQDGPFGSRESLSGYSNVREAVLGGYVWLQFGGSAWSGNAGIRAVRTETRSSGYVTPVLGVTVTPGDDTLQFGYGPSTGIVIRNSYVNALPSLNIKLNLTPEIVARAAFSQTITRPTLTDLGVSDSLSGRVSAPLSSGGNPNLTPFRSINYDASLEWYLSRISYLSVGVFYKDLRDFLELQTLSLERFGRTFLDTRTRNGQSGYIRGVEFGGQYLFDWLPGAASGLGITGNYTYVESEARRDLTLADYDCGYNGLSPHSANGSIFYEKLGLSARVSYNWRSDYLRSCRSEQSRPRNRSSYGQLDVSLSFDIARDVQIYAQGINITNAHIKEWSAIEDRFLLMQSTGSRYNFGVRITY